MRNQFEFRGENGFTLVELLVSLLISGILVFTVMSVFLMSQKLYIQGEGISYKQKSITNVETELQNSLGIAEKVKIIETDPEITDPNTIDMDRFDYYIGFDASGNCNIGSGGYISDQVKDIELEIVGDTMSYKLIPKNSSMSILNGGIVLNNFHHPDFEYDASVNTPWYENRPRYLVVQFAKP